MYEKRKKRKNRRDLLEQEDLADGPLAVDMADGVSKQLVNAQDTHLGAAVCVVGDTVADDQLVQAALHHAL